ncbi:MAG: ScpA family protein [Actinomycetota bacterium]
MSDSAFAVELPVFSGPFRALADLILDRKVDVCDVSVADVTNAFLEYAKEADDWDLEEATWFLAVCALMLELKVDRLMPRHETLDDEDLAMSPDLVYARSLELAAFRRLTEIIALRLEEGARYHSREAGPAPEFAHLYPDLTARVTPDDLQAAVEALLRPPTRVDLSHVTPIRVTMAEAMQAVEARMGELRAARFRELVADCRERIHVVVRFLALLELYRTGRVHLEQAETFGEIEVKWQG